MEHHSEDQAPTSRGHTLIHKYHTRDLTLQECYELERWLEEGPLKRPWTPPQHLMAYQWILNGVRALIIDKRYAATGRLPASWERRS